MNNSRLKYVVYTAILLALSLIIGVIENLIPAMIPTLPFIKVGFSNIVIIFAIVAVGTPSALVISILKSILVPLFVGNPVMIAYSLCASLTATLFMSILLNMRAFGILIVSIIGAIIHITMQLLVASLMTSTFMVFSYFFYLALIAIISGLVTGIISYILIRFFPKNVINTKKD